VNYIPVNVKQGSVQWFAARCGIPTASNFDSIVTPKTYKPTANEARRTYRAKLLYEIFTGLAADNYVDPAMERGTLLEPKAREWYSFATNREVKQVGFCYKQGFAGKFGASPDGLCEDRGLEIKCIYPANHIRLLLADEADAAAPYYSQCQAGIWVCGADLWDLVLYCPEDNIPRRIITIHRDDKLCAAFDEYIPAFCQELAECKARMITMGGEVVKTAEIPDWAMLPGDEPAQEGATA